MSDNRGSSSYSADFENLFGSGKNGEEEEEGSQMNWVQPTALLAEAGALREDVHAREDVTPSILLEQLAYVDNFMPSLEQEYANLDSWILSDGQEAGGQNEANGRSMGFDERLAAELSAFADDSFIFPDEDKRQQSSSKDGDNESGESGKDNGNEQSNSHFLTQRRNTFLTSQYDHSKSRFSSRKKRPIEQERQSRSTGSDSRGSLPAQDHGGFVNVDIAPSNGHSMYAPTVRSPLNSLVASQPYSLSNTPETTVSRSSWSNDQMPSADEGAPRIQLPDYSKIPTSTLVALLPRVAVPPGAYQSLINQGLDADQIDAIAVIIAHYEQEKQKRRENGQSSRTNSSEVDPAANNGASFLIDILFNGSQPRRQGQSPTYQSPIETSPVEKQESQPVTNDAIITEAISRKRSTDSIRRDAELPLHTEARELKRQKSSSAIPPTSKVHSKRKVKESELESSVHELSELAVSLQQKIHTLEMENELLKNLVISSGESEGVERAEKIKKEILKKIKDTRKNSDDSNTRDTPPKEESI